MEWTIGGFRLRASFWGLVMAAALGWLTWGSIARIWDTAHHTGPWVIYVGEDGDIPKVVTPDKFRRHHYAEAWMMLALSGVFWWALLASAIDRPKT